MATNTTLALETIANKGIDITKDFYTLSFGNRCELSELAKNCGYKRPRNANGSTARYFWEYLQRVNNRGAK